MIIQTILVLFLLTFAIACGDIAEMADFGDEKEVKQIVQTQDEASADDSATDPDKKNCHDRMMEQGMDGMMGSDMTGDGMMSDEMMNSEMMDSSDMISDDEMMGNGMMGGGMMSGQETKGTDNEDDGDRRSGGQNGDHNGHGHGSSLTGMLGMLRKLL